MTKAYRISVLRVGSWLNAAYTVKGSKGCFVPTLLVPNCKMNGCYLEAAFHVRSDNRWLLPNVEPAKFIKNNRQSQAYLNYRFVPLLLLKNSRGIPWYI